VEVYGTFFIGFIAGIICLKIWNYIYSYGIITLAVKVVIDDCLRILVKNMQSTLEINELKYLALEISGKDERFVEFQKNLDARELSSMRNTVIRNFINCVPTKYNHLVPFDDWLSAVQYVNNEAKKAKETQK
jgi:hypothetical protein